MNLTAVYTPHIGREVWLREGNESDERIWADTFTGLYHVPPDSMPTPATVLDLGANIGLTAAHYQYLWPQAQVVAVEMDAECCALARRNAPGVNIRSHAVSARGGWGSYDPNVRADARSFRPADRSGNLMASYTLRQVILRSFGHRVDFVKMDVEGAEWGIMDLASWAPLVRFLLVELHGKGPGPDLIACAVERLHALGFYAAPHLPHPQAVRAWR
jgi:FkbM family methyltransferase